MPPLNQSSTHHTSNLIDPDPRITYLRCIRANALKPNFVIDHARSATVNNDRGYNKGKRCGKNTRSRKCSLSQLIKKLYCSGQMTTCGALGTRWVRAFSRIANMLKNKQNMVVENGLDIAGVASSILATPTIKNPAKSATWRAF
jgi:hypothetical protein